MEACSFSIELLTIVIDLIKKYIKKFDLSNFFKNFLLIIILKNNLKNFFN